MEVHAENLLVDRKHLLDIIMLENEKDVFPPELMKHLQPWKSEFLHAMNIAAYKLYSNIERSKITDVKLEAKTIQETILKELTEKKVSNTKLSTAATLLRHDYDNPKAKNFISHTDIQSYPIYFSYKLKYLNDKCKKYHDDYYNKITKHEMLVELIEDELHKDNIIPDNTIKRLSSTIKPNYKKITRPDE